MPAIHRCPCTCSTLYMMQQFLLTTYTCYIQHQQNVHGRHLFFPDCTQLFSNVLHCTKSHAHKVCREITFLAVHCWKRENYRVIPRLPSRRLLCQQSPLASETHRRKTQAAPSWQTQFLWSPGLHRRCSHDFLMHNHKNQLLYWSWYSSAPF